MTTIHDQRPKSGCANCGAEVRTRKAGGWICSRCQKAMDRLHRGYSMPMNRGDANAVARLLIGDDRYQRPITVVPRCEGGFGVAAWTNPKGSGSPREVVLWGPDFDRESF